MIVKSQKSLKMCVRLLIAMLVVFLNESSALELQRKECSKFGSTIFNNPRAITQKELYLSTRTTFGTKDYLEELILAKATQDDDEGLRAGTIGVAVGAVVLPSLVLPQLDISMPVKNALGLFFLFSPFAWLLLSQIAPNLVTDARKTLNSRADGNQRERICYHEAGHFIAAYLSGLRTEEYDISVDLDSGTAISESNLELGNFLICALAGCVAETLRFGDSSGGRSDISVALDALRRMRIRSAEHRGYLRWATLKALSLLRLHRDALDDVAQNMALGAPVEELEKILEEC